MQAYYGLPGQVMAQIQACHAGTLESASEWIARYVASGRVTSCYAMPRSY